MCVGVDFHGNACCSVDGRWRRFGGSLRRLSLCCSGRQLWGVGSQGRLINRSSAKYDKWIVVNATARLKQVKAFEDGSKMLCLDRKGFLGLFSPTGKRLHNLGEGFDHMSASGEGSHIWATDLSGRVYYRAGLKGRRQQIGGRICRIAVSADGCHVWGRNQDNHIYYRAGRYGRWAEVTSRWADWKLDQVCVSANGWQVWGTDIGGSVWTFTT